MKAAGRTIAPGAGVSPFFFPTSPASGEGVGAGSFGDTDDVDAAGIDGPPLTPPVDPESAVIVIQMSNAHDPNATSKATTSAKTAGAGGSGGVAKSASPSGGGGKTTGDIPPRGFTALIGDAFRSLATWIWPPVIDPLYTNMRDDGFLYHGTSFERLDQIVRSGGTMATQTSYFSSEAGFSFGYARSSARKTGTPGFVLQFPWTSLDGRIERGHYTPVYAPGRGMPAVLAFFGVATEPIPLSAQTEESKQTILRWIAAQRDANPGDASWGALLAKFVEVLQPIEQP